MSTPSSVPGSSIHGSAEASDLIGGAAYVDEVSKLLIVNWTVWESFQFMDLKLLGIRTKKYIFVLTKSLTPNYSLRDLQDQKNAEFLESLNMHGLNYRHGMITLHFSTDATSLRPHNSQCSRRFAVEKSSKIGTVLSSLMTVIAASL